MFDGGGFEAVAGLRAEDHRKWVSCVGGRGGGSDGYDVNG